ncbi:hypothetical protein OHV05_11910 [Kitasatospora sp. NBC_00070]|uniref:hypothetical protein n=1 Tax=Kitasatospora sp. NBC_00070 TaxID=2975962 RepID=UPI00324BCD11
MAPRNAALAGLAGLAGLPAVVLGGLSVWWFSAAYDERHRAVLASCLDLPANTGMRVGAWGALGFGLLAVLLPLGLRLLGRARLGLLPVLALLAGLALVGTGVFLVTDTLGQGSGRRLCSGAAPPVFDVRSAQNSE